MHLPFGLDKYLPNRQFNAETADFTGLRIAMVSDAVYPYNIGGKERALYEIGKRLVARGHVVDVYTMQWWKDSPTVQHDGMTYHALMPFRPLYASEGHRSIREAMAFGLATVKMLPRTFDVFLVDSIPFLPLLSGRLVAWLRNKELSTIWQEYWGPESWKMYVDGPGAIVGAYLERVAVHCPNKILSISLHTTDRLTPIAGQGRVVTIPMGVDLQSIDNAERSEERIDVMYAGRFLDHKNVDLLIEAIGQLREDFPTISCVIVGDGPEKARFDRLVETLDLQSHVSIRPFYASDADLYGLMKSSEVFVLPSTREGFGLTIIEANACGTPVITSNHPDNAGRDLVRSGSNGMVCTPETSDVASKIRTVLRGGVSMDSEALRQSVETRDWSFATLGFEQALSIDTPLNTKVFGESHEAITVNSS